MTQLRNNRQRKSLQIRRRYSAKNDVTLFQGDCLRLLSQIPSRSAQLVITSPPYNVGKPYEKKKSIEQYLEMQRTVIAEAIRITRVGGSICWQVGHHVNGYQQVIPLDLLLYPEFQKHSGKSGIRLRNRIVWHFEHGLHCKHRFSGRHETILWYTKGDKCVFNLDHVRVPQKYPGKKGHKGARRGQYTGNPLGKNPGDVWIFPNVKNNHIEKTEHPCQFPVELPERLILALTNPGDLVVDPFIGVGSTAVAAVLNKRRAAGAELRAEYVKLARKRIMAAHRGKLRYRKSNTPVHVMAANTPLRTLPEEFIRYRMQTA